MNLQNDRQLANTERKLTQVEQQIEKAKSRPASAENDDSIQSLSRVANQLREEIIRYQAAHTRRAS